MHVAQILTEARIGHEPFSAGRPGVYLSAALQLVGSYADLKRFQAAHRDYFRWEAHHVVEAQDIVRLGVQSKFPERDAQLCVLLPKQAHRNRINSLLRHENPAGITVDFPSLKAAYAEAYALVGNYCGGGERAIRQELLAIVDAIFRMARRR